jgi:hypothetical protein
MHKRDMTLIMTTHEDIVVYRYYATYKTTKQVQRQEKPRKNGLLVLFVASRTAGRRKIFELLTFLGMALEH